MSRPIINLYHHVEIHKIYIGVNGKVYISDKNYPLNDGKKSSLRKTAMLILKMPSMFTPIDPYYVEKDLIDAGMYLLYTDEQYKTLKEEKTVAAKIEHTKTGLETPNTKFEGILLDSLKTGDVFSPEGTSTIYQMVSGGAELWKDQHRIVINLRTQSISYMPKVTVIAKLFKSVTVKVE